MMISYTPLSHTAFMQDSGHDIKFTWCDQVTGGARTQGQQKKQKHDCSAKHGWAHNEHVEVDQRSDVMSTVVTSTYLCRTTCCVRCRVRPDTIGYYWWWSQSESSHETILFLFQSEIWWGCSKFQQVPSPNVKVSRHQHRSKQLLRCRVKS